MVRGNDGGGIIPSPGSFVPSLIPLAWALVTLSRCTTCPRSSLLSCSRSCSFAPSSAPSPRIQPPSFVPTIPCTPLYPPWFVPSLALLLFVLVRSFVFVLAGGLILVFLLDLFQLMRHYGSDTSCVVFIVVWTSFGPFPARSHLI